MAVTTAMSALGLAALIALPGAHHAPGPGPSTQDEAVPGAESLHVSLETPSDDERPAPGDHVGYTIRVRNSGAEALPEAEIVQFLPPTVRYVSGSAGTRAAVEDGRVTWTQDLGPGERASFRVTGEITGVLEDGAHPVTTVCLRPEPGAALAACSSAVHRVHATVPLVWVVAGLLLLAVATAVGTVGCLCHPGTRRPRPAPAVPDNHTPEPAPNVRAFTDEATVYELDAHR
ncbi:hypothetical protein Q8791_24810 [Nocardiopsis sp. CT-R113]|uniref:DUF11 domain-containing protein n=1 Tax=Nocardiopsis codii TaxID=3065942 RepID=A0ABU7KDY4_9ACTN|nr:hypothetical protein [Nocardiopsis sp. CT-R113]MEE2040446.1 hypothetical protein [Nocardiopsis sp. CT-R113]